MREGGPALRSRVGLCIWCHVLTKHCFSFRDIEQFFPKDSALGGHPVPGPQFVDFTVELWVHLLQHRQQPLSDVLGTDGGVHLERTQR